MAARGFYNVLIYRKLDARYADYMSLSEIEHDGAVTSYDALGRMTFDSTTGQSMTYNSLDLEGCCVLAVVLAEKYPGVSPYAFCNNNPVNFVNPDGYIST